MGSNIAKELKNIQNILNSEKDCCKGHMDPVMEVPNFEGFFSTSWVNDKKRDKLSNFFINAQVYFERLLE